MDTQNQSPTQPTPPVQAHELPDQSVSPSPEQKKSSKLWLILIGVIVIPACVATAYYIGMQAALYLQDQQPASQAVSEESSETGSAESSEAVGEFAPDDDSFELYELDEFEASLRDLSDEVPSGAMGGAMNGASDGTASGMFDSTGSEVLDGAPNAAIDSQL